jgi:hypothetical protein
MNRKFDHYEQYVVTGGLLNGVADAIHLLYRHDSQRITADESRDMANRLHCLINGSNDPFLLSDLMESKDDI